MFEETAEAGSSLYLTSPTFSPFFLETGHKTPMWKVPSLHQEEGRHSYHQTGNLGPRNLCKLVKLNLTFRGTFPPFRTPSPNPSDLPVLCKFIVVSLSKRYRSFLLWSYLWVFILLCRLLWKSHQNTEIFYKICMLFSTCLYQFNFQRVGTLKRWGETSFLSYSFCHPPWSAISWGHPAQSWGCSQRP